jgi:CelD/BcsL family acetyltransferase involved in cellulose biosynthesis
MPMTKPLSLAAFEQASPAVTARVVEGLPGAIDRVAEAAAETHRFLRFGWFAAALAAYGGEARTLVVEEDGQPVLALPMVRRRLGLVHLLGVYWPFRSFPLALEASPAALAAGMKALRLPALRIGPVYDGDAAVEPLLCAARAAGWATLDRHVADSWLLDMGAAVDAGDWPRNSTLKKNRFHEKHLAAHGALDWRFVSGAEWPAAFDALAAIEEASWIASRTDGSDAKFTRGGHGAFWRAAAADPVLADMFSAALLNIDGRPAAFSFDIDVGATRYAIANSYDPAYARHSPGKLLYWRNLVAAIGRTRTVDWGGGDGGYKRVIGAKQGPAIRDWLLVRPGLPAMAARLLAGVWRRAG